MARYSETIRFNVDCADCTRFTPYRFTWLNRLGGFDSYTFRLKSTRTITKETNEYDRFVSSLQSDDRWSYLFGDRGKSVYYTEAFESYSVVSTWHDEQTHQWLEELFTSPEVYLITTDEFGQVVYDPIIVTTKSVEIRDKKGYSRLLSHTIEFSKAYSIVIQR